MTGVLSGIRVLDFGRYIAGPYCATILADFGAEVIRLEKLDGSEDRYVSPIMESGEGALYMQMGRNKKGMTLNPMKPEGREIVRKLIETADIVVANLPLETLEAMALDYESLRAVKDDIILVHASAFGTEGPYKNRVGFDGIGQAMSGAMYMSGENGRPQKLYSPFVDFSTAMTGAIGAMAALMERSQSGKGQVVTTSLFGTSTSLAGASLIEQAAINVNRVGTGNRGQSAGPADTFQTSDGWVLVQSIGRPLFKRWCSLMGEDHWLEDSRFETDQDRGDNNEIISERMAKWCLERTTAEAIREMEEVRLPCGPVLSPQQLLDDEHLSAMNLLTDVAYPGLGKPARVSEFPIRMSESQPSIRERAPTLGEHTDKIMTELGYSAGEISDLKSKRVI